MNAHLTAATGTDHGSVQISYGRAWIAQDASVRIGYTLAEPSSPPEGQGPKTVVLIHGAPQTRHTWRKVLVPLAQAGYRVIAPDYRGAGASTKPRDGYDKWTMAADLYTLVHDHLGVQGPVSVVGHDLGSMLVFGYALRYRDDVVSLTTMEAPPARHGLLRAAQGRQERLALRLPRQPRHRRPPHPRPGTLVHHAVLRRPDLPARRDHRSRCGRLRARLPSSRRHARPVRDLPGTRPRRPDPPRRHRLRRQAHRPRARLRRCRPGTGRQLPGHVRGDRRQRHRPPRGGRRPLGARGEPGRLPAHVPRLRQPRTA
ncbi:alpha/beta hydrolase [Streptomyces sp. RTd22]|uniref:alpha/beta fold hydrolase n=1 Tax=Streptomyces sp. RTd22 TaxID=1841249 RepID=UPI0009A077D7